MARCAHIYDSGFQCVDETVAPTELCSTHQRVVAFESLADSPWRKIVLRVVAFVLLLLLLVPVFYTLKNLHWGPAEDAQEAW
jgi:hypothetical protein